MSGNIRKLANQTAYYGLSSIVGRIINFFLVPLYVRIFTEGEYGVYTNIYAYFTFLNILYTYGMETTYFRFVNQEGDARRVFSTTTFSLTVTTLVFTVMFFLGQSLFSSVMGYADHPEYTLWIMSILALDTLAVSSFALLRYRERPIKFAFIKIVNILVNVSGNLFFLIACPYILGQASYQAVHPLILSVYSPDIGIGYIFISNIIASAVTLLMLFKELAEFNFDIDLSLLKRMLVYSAPLVVVGFAGMVNDNLDRTILKHLLPHSAEENDILLGIYGANAKLSVFMVLVIQAFKYAAEPFFFLQSGKSDAKATYAEVMKYFVIFGLMIFLFVDLYMDLFKYLVGRSGSRYHEGLGLVPILLLANLFLGIYYNLSIWYKLKDRTRIGAYISVAGAVVTIALNILWVPSFGYFASAWTKLICYVTMVFLSYMIGRRYYPVDYKLKRLAFYFAVAILIHAVFSQVSGHLAADHRLLLFFVSTAFLAAYGVIFLYVEKIPIRGVFRRKL